MRASPHYVRLPPGDDDVPDRSPARLQGSNPPCGVSSELPSLIIEVLRHAGRRAEEARGAIGGPSNWPVAASAPCPLASLLPNAIVDASWRGRITTCAACGDVFTTNRQPHKPDGRRCREHAQQRAQHKSTARCPDCGASPYHGFLHHSDGRACRRRQGEQEAVAASVALKPRGMRKRCRPLRELAESDLWGKGGVCTIRAEDVSNPIVLAAVLSRIDYLSEATICSAFYNDPRKGKVMVPLADDAALSELLDKLLEAELTPHLEAMFAHGDICDVPRFAVGTTVPGDIVAVGQRSAPLGRPSCRRADGSVHLHRDIQPTHIQKGGAIYGVVLLLGEVTEATGCTVIYGGSQEVQWHVKNRRRARDCITACSKTFATGKRGDMFVFDVCNLHEVIAATAGAGWRCVCIFDLVTPDIMKVGTTWAKREGLTERLPLGTPVPSSPLSPTAPRPANTSPTPLPLVAPPPPPPSDEVPVVSPLPAACFARAATSSVRSLDVGAEHAAACHAALNTNWSNGTLRLASGRGGNASGYTTYAHTVAAHDSAEQGRNTIILSEAILPAARSGLPGFAAMERAAAAWLRTTFNLAVLPILLLSHVLRQTPNTLGSTVFSEHRDDEDLPLVAYSVIVKVTSDEPGAPPSQMRLVSDQGAIFNYGETAGAAAMFHASMLHSSVPLPTGAPEVLKVAYFFRRGLGGTRSER